VVLEADRQGICTLILVLGVRTRRGGLCMIETSDSNLKIIDNGGESLRQDEHAYSVKNKRI
jgi:hypothetical protein